MRWEIGLGIVLPPLLLLLCDRYEMAIGYLLAVSVHECGHLFAVRLVGGRVIGIRFGLTGGVISCRGLRSYGREIAVSLAGVICNGIAAYLLSLVGMYTGRELWYLFAGIQLALGGFNLLPVPSLDGGNALYAYLCLLTAPNTAYAAIWRLGFVISFVLIGFGVYIFGKTRYNGSMLLCGASLFASCLQELRAVPNCLKGTNLIYAEYAEET